MPPPSEGKSSQQVKLYKLTKSRASFSLYNYFIKIAFIKRCTYNNIAQSLDAEYRGSFYTDHIVHVPKVLISKRFFFFQIEVSENIKNTEPLFGDKQKEGFYNKAQEKVLSISKDYVNISWEEILPPLALIEIKGHKKEFNFIQESLSCTIYPKTGMHGDLNSNNILLDENKEFWLVDWENSSSNGSVIWDLYWLYSIWKRDSSKAPNDILSIYNSIDGIEADPKELLLIYTLMKLRIDLMRHQKDIVVSLNSFLQRVLKIMEIC